MKRFICFLFTIFSIVILTGCELHFHTYENEYSYDETSHYYKSTCGHDVVKGKEEHIYENDSNVCVKCGYEKEVIILECPHEKGDHLEFDEENHYYVSNCEHKVKYDIEKHQFDLGVIIKEASISETGEIKYTCVSCKYEKIDTIPMLECPHEKNKDWAYDDNTHYHESNCIHKIEYDKENHDYTVLITMYPTYEENGEAEYQCNVCGYIKNVSIDKLEENEMFIDGYNTQDITNGMGKYQGLDIYIKDVMPGATKFWYKVLIKKVNDDYIVSSIIPDGEDLAGDYDFILLSYRNETTGTFKKLTSLGITKGDKVNFNIDLETINSNDVNSGSTLLKVSFTKRAKYKITLIYDDKTIIYDDGVYENTLVTLPKYNKVGYEFKGWYLDSNYKNKVSDEVTIVSDLTLYGLYEKKAYFNPLDYINDVVNSDTIDILPSEIDGQVITYYTSNDLLYTIKDGKGYTNRLYQTYKKQIVKVSASVTKDNVTNEYSKDIIINPVTYKKMTNPKAVYFSVSSTSSYMKYNERYKQNKSLFPEKFKNNMDIVYYAFAIPQNDGSVYLNDVYLNEVMKLKENGIRVLMVIDGANRASLQAMVQLCNNDHTRSVFVNNIISLVLKYNFDGVDVDWEFPGVSGLTGYTTEMDRTNLNKLLRDLRNKLNENEDEGGSKHILSIASPSTYWGTHRYDYDGRFSNGVGGINDYCDYVNMMSYDLHKSGSASHLTHLHTPSNNYSYKFSVDYGVTYFTSLGLEKNKIIIGSAAYGKAYNLTGDVNESSTYPALGVAGKLGQVQNYNLPLQSLTFNSGTIYYTAIKILLNSGNFKQYDEYNNDNKFVGSYLYSSKDKVYITFDSEKAVYEKCKYAKENGLGIMVWAYGEDATDTIVNTICKNL